MPYLRNSIAYDYDFWYTCVKWWYLHGFFSVFQILIFWFVMGVKGQKTVQNNKKFCLSCFISQKLYVIWLSFMVHLCKMVISPGIFFYFLKIWIFWIVKEKKGQEIDQNDKKFCHALISQEPYIIWFSFMVHMYKVIISPGDFSIFLKFWFFRFLGG